MKYLIGDIGNTSTKICILNKEFKILRSYEFQTDKIYKGSFLKKFLSNKLTKDFNKFFLFSSVVPNAFKEIKKKFKNSQYKCLEI